jgi:hypothetical protein
LTVCFLADRHLEGEHTKVTEERKIRMTAYRCYLLEYHIGAVKVIDCPDDGEATKRADALLAGMPAFRAIEDVGSGPPGPRAAGGRVA